eukprot:355618-Chlamydomonas_euryale.AAC.2
MSFTTSFTMNLFQRRILARTAQVAAGIIRTPALPPTLPATAGVLRAAVSAALPPAAAGVLQAAVSATLPPRRRWRVASRRLSNTPCNCQRGVTGRPGALHHGCSPVVFSFPPAAWPPPQVVLPDSACATAEGGAALRGALVAAGVPLLCLPPAVGVMMAAHSPRPPRAVTPAMARTVLVHAAPRRAAPLAVQHVPKLLDYCLSDVVPDGGSAEQLQGLPLLPLRDGSVAAIQPRAQARKRMLPPHARAVATAA